MKNEHETRKHHVDPADPAVQLVAAAVVVTVVLHIGVFAVVGKQAAIHQTLFAGDLRVFALVSLALSLGMRIPSSGRLPQVFLGVRVVLYLLVGSTLASSPVAAALLLSALAADAGSCFGFPWSILGVMVVAVAGIAGEVMPSTLRPGNVGRSDLVSLLPIPIVVGGLSVMLRVFVDNLSAEREHTQTLNDAVIQLTSANSGFLRYASNAERESAQEERRHITRELHDIVGQTLTDIISMMDASVRNPMETVDQQKRLHQWVRDQSQHCLQETRAVLYRLRSMPDAPLSGTAAIKNLVDTFSAATGVAVRLEWSNTPADLGQPLNTVLYRVVQEALVNAFRHGRAQQVWIAFRLDDGAIHLLVEDDGHGSPESKKGIGQMGMEERIEKVGGSITFGSTGTGYQVRAVCPFAGVDSYETVEHSAR